MLLYGVSNVCNITYKNTLCQKNARFNHRPPPRHLGLSRNKSTFGRLHADYVVG